MGDSNDHRRGSVSNNFCSVAGTPCNCGNHYTDNCKDQATEWGKYPQKFTKKNKSTKLIEEIRQNQRSFEAHHLLPVACVTEVILEWDEENNADPSVITGTKWCINEKSNMIALPMWGHTIKHYTKNFEALSQEVIDEIESANVASVGRKRLGKISKEVRKAISNTVTTDTEPPFKDLPQHNFSHTGKTAATGYNKEIINKLKNIVMKVEQAQNAHQTDKVDSLKGKLNDLSTRMEKKLHDRGTRAYDGTHPAWKEGMKDPHCDWYKSFSMAQTPPKMTFPLGKTSGSMARKIFALARALWMPG